jgi:hypothetical protein
MPEHCSLESNIQDKEEPANEGVSTFNFVRGYFAGAMNSLDKLSHSSFSKSYCFIQAFYQGIDIHLLHDDLQEISTMFCKLVEGIFLQKLTTKSRHVATDTLSPI